MVGGRREDMSEQERFTYKVPVEEQGFWENKQTRVDGFYCEEFIFWFYCAIVKSINKGDHLGSMNSRIRLAFVVSP